MRARAIALFLLTTSAPAIAGSEVFEKWRTPAGTLHIGHRPPTGSVLLERIELVATDPPAAVEPVALREAARDGREIIRQRAAEREAERDRDLARDLREREIAETAPPPVLLVSGGFSHRSHRRRDGFHPRLGIGPSPVSGTFRPNLALVTPNESARQMAPSFSPPRSLGHRSPRGRVP